MVQYRFLKHEIDSARLTTDSGVDLVAYSPLDGKATTIQVKTVRAPGPAGGAGLPANGWWFPQTCKGEVLALVRLSTDSVWLFTLGEARELAQQHDDKGNRQLYWYTDETRVPSGARQERDMEAFQFDRRVSELFLGAADPKIAEPANS